MAEVLVKGVNEVEYSASIHLSAPC